MLKIATSRQLVYVVDDDVATARLVAVNLAANGYQVKQFHSGHDALASLQREHPDLIVLDLVMPDFDGLEIAKEIRQSSLVPILVLSVRDETTSKLAALELGADDYVTKPFRVDELLARVRAILRRTSSTVAVSPPPDYSYKSDELLIDIDGMRVISHHRPVHLTPKEWAILRVLVKNAGRVVSSRQLLRAAWGADYGDEGDYVRTYVTRLRRKLEPDPRHPRYILLERGLGYRLVESD